MAGVFRILYLEDSTADAELVLHALAEEGLRTETQVAATGAEFIKALEAVSPDIILADHSVPGFSGVEALQLRNERCPETPFIFVSGQMGEDVAVEALKSGASDYVLKSNLRRLGPAVRRALNEQEEHQRRVRAEAALRKSEAHLRQAQERAQMGSWELDLATKTGWWSEQMFAMMRIDLRERPPGFDEFLKLVHPDDRKAIVAGLEESERQAESRSVEFRTHPSKPPISNLQAKLDPLRDENGRVTRMIGTLVDVTERKRSEREARLSEERFVRQRNAIIELIGAPVFAEKDVGGALRGITEVASRTLDVARVSIWRYNETKDAIRCVDLYDARSGEHSEGLTLERAAYPGYFAALDKGEVIDAVDANVDERTAEFGSGYLASHGIGAMLDVPIHIGGRLVGVICQEHVGGAREWLHDEEAFGVAIASLASLAFEGSKRRRAEDRIVAQAALLDAASDAIIQMTLKDEIVFWNQGACVMFGWEREEALGKNCRDLLKLDREKFKEANAEVLKRDRWDGELKCTTKDERVRTCLLRWSLVRDKEGEPKSILAIITDVTERRNLEAQFLRAQRMESIGTLASGIAHDLNNVLAPILMSIETLRLMVDPEAEELLDMMKTSAVRGADLVKQVLTFGRGVEGQRVTVNLIHLLREIQKIIRDTFPKNIRFELVPGKGLWTVSGDPTHLHQVFMNLCVNARDAMPHGGRLAVQVENTTIDEVYAGQNPGARAGDYVQVTVADTGTGIPQDIKDKIFEPFFTTKEIGRGTGLGLSTTLAILKGLGGFVTLYSEVGKGTQFKVYLPAMRSLQSIGEGEDKEDVLPAGNNQLILVVDDEEAVRTMAKSTLERFKYRAIVAQNGAAALAIFVQRQKEIALVITDMAMPVMDGPATISALRSIQPGIKVIGSSGLSSEKEIGKVSGEVLQGFLAKPYTAQTLLKTVHKALESGAASSSPTG